MINKTNYLLAIIVIALINHSCVSPIGSEYTKLPPGKWRAILYLNESVLIQPADKKDVESKSYIDGELPFNFEVVYDDAEKFHIDIINAEERIRIDNIVYQRDKATAKDTIHISFKDFDTDLYAVYEEGIMEGYWQVNYRNNYRIKFKAFHGDSTRFLFVKNDIPADYQGRWQAKFSEGTADEYPAVIDLKQDGSFLTGTVLTETGDYRYLHGNVAGSKAWLSCFDGSHAFLFEMKIDESKNMIGLFRSGKHHQEPFNAIKNPEAKLMDADALVGFNHTNDKFVIQHPNEKGETINSAAGKYQGKIKIIDVMGTWCPNCKDATIYLKELKKRMPDVEIIALAFERYRDAQKALDQLKKYKDQMDLPYEIVLGGYYDKKEASAALPQIEKVMAYPTLLLVDKNDRLVKVFTGFYGPATKEYKSFTQKIESAINHL